MYTLHENDALEFQLKASTTYLKTFFGNFEEVFGHHDNVKITMKSLSVPTIDIKEEETSLSCQGLISFLNPYNSDYEAITMNANFEATLSFDLTENFAITGQIVDMKIYLTEFNAFFKTSATLEYLNLQVGSLVEPFVSLVNSQIVNSFGVPMPQQLTSTLSKTRLFTYNKFILVESDPQLEMKLKATISSLADQFNFDQMSKSNSASMEIQISTGE